MKETYRVKRPERIVFGDPLYFKKYPEERLKKLTVDLALPEYFSARVVLEEMPIEGCPGLIGRTMTFCLASETTSMDAMRSLVSYFFEEVENVEKPKELGEPGQDSDLGRGLVIH